MSQSAAEYVASLTPALDRLRREHAARPVSDRLYDMLIDAPKEGFCFDFRSEGVVRAAWWDHADGWMACREDRNGKSRRAFDSKEDALTWALEP